MLDKLKLLLPSADATVLGTLIENATAYFCSYCNQTAVPSTAQSIIIKMVLEDYGRLGADGLNSRSFAGVNESYLTDYSAIVLAQLAMYRKVLVV